MRKTAGLVAAVVAFGAFGAVPASAGQGNVVKGGNYKGDYVVGGAAYNFRVKVNNNDRTKGNFSLQCAGIEREPIEIAKGKFKLAFGADTVQLKGRGHFQPNDEVKGAITMISAPGAACMGGGTFLGQVVN